MAITKHCVRMLRGSHLVALFVLVITSTRITSYRFPKESLSCKRHHDELDCSNRNLRTVQAFRDDGISNIARLDLSSNKLEHLTNEPFRMFSALQILDLHYNRIVNVSVGVFTGLQVLHELDLRQNSLTTLKADVFKDLVNLKTLKLSVNKIRELGHHDNDPDQSSPFRHLTLLEHVYLDHNSIHSIEQDAFNGLRNLQTLTLSLNKIEQLPNAVFRNLSTLRVLDLSDNHLKLPPSEAISPLNMLETLDLSYNKFVTFTLGEGFKNLTRLIKFIYDNNEGRSSDVVVNNTFQNMPKQLQSLSFITTRDTILELGVFNPLYIRYLSVVAPMSLDVFQLMNCSLVTLIFWGCRNLRTTLDGDTLSSLGKVNGSLTKLRLHQGSLEKIENFAFSMLTNLAALHVTDNHLEYISYHAFHGLNNLFVLDLSVNNLKNVPPTLLSFHNLIALKELDLRLNRLFNNFRLDYLANLTALESLYLQGNALIRIWCELECPLNIRTMNLSNMYNYKGIMLFMVIYMNRVFPHLETLHLVQMYPILIKFPIPVCTFAPNLLKCDLTNVGLYSLNGTSLLSQVLGKECKYLSWLDISRSAISFKLDKQSDVLLPHLNKLVANHNKLPSLKNLSFLISPNLTILEATGNEFTTIERVSLLDNVTHLSLSGNQIESLNGVFHLRSLKNCFSGRIPSNT